MRIGSPEPVIPQTNRPVGQFPVTSLVDLEIESKVYIGGEPGKEAKATIYQTLS